MTEEYRKYRMWERKQELPILTGTQKEFAEYILDNEELKQMLTHPGDLLSVMQRVQRYLKDS